MALDFLPSPGWAVIYGETPSATRWSELGDNDDALATGAGLDDNSIKTRHIQLANNTPLMALTAGAVEKQLMRLGANDQLRLGQIKNKLRSTVTLEDQLYIQTGWDYIQGNGSAGMQTGFTFAEAFDQALGIVLIMEGVKSGGVAPTGPTDAGITAAAEYIGGAGLSNTGYSTYLRHPAGSALPATVYWAFSYIAWGRKA